MKNTTARLLIAALFISAAFCSTVLGADAGHREVLSKETQADAAWGLQQMAIFGMANPEYQDYNAAFAAISAHALKMSAALNS